MSCDNVCPAEVAPGSQIYQWRQRLDKLSKADKLKKVMSEGMSMLFDHPGLYKTALWFAPLANYVPDALTHYSNLNPWGIGHKKPVFAKKSFHEWWKEHKA